MRNRKQLIYTNERGESVVFSHASVYHTNDINGLSDISSAIYTVSSMGQDGDTFVGSRIDSREIEVFGVINIRNKDLQDEYRRRLIRVLNPQLSGSLLYDDGKYRRIIDCRIALAPKFTKSPIFQSFTAEFICLYPFWREEQEVKSEIAAWIGNFSFPISLDDSEESENGGFITGYMHPSLVVNIQNSGDIMSGIRVEFRSSGTVENPKLISISSAEFIRFNFTMQAGDTLSISTGYGNKKASLIREGVVSDALRYLDPDSTFIQLLLGDNLFRYDSDAQLENLEVAIYHENLYLGV